MLCKKEGHKTQYERMREPGFVRLQKGKLVVINMVQDEKE